MRKALLAAVVLLAGIQIGEAADVQVLSAAAVKVPLTIAQGLAPAATGFGLHVEYGTAGAIRDKVAAGTLADVVVLPPARLDELVGQGLVATDSRVSLGTVRLGIAVKSGAPRPAVATEKDIRATLSSAPSIGLADPASGATTGIYFAKLLKQMRLDETLKPKIRLFSDGTTAMEALARGDVALAAGQISEIKPVAGVDLVGPLPESMQLRTVYAAGLASHAAAPEAARATIDFLASPAMAQSFVAAGFDSPLARVMPKLVDKQGDYIAHDFHFQSGETLPELKLHYTTLGTPVTDAAGHVTNAVLALHGTTGMGRNFLSPLIAGVLFGPGQPLDVSKYFIIMPDGIGRGGSSKPSDGLRTRFPHYGYIGLGRGSTRARCQRVAH